MAKPKGWRNESRRHSLASRGVRTTENAMDKSVRMPGSIIRNYNRRGFLDDVVNTNGQKNPVRIYQGESDGFTAEDRVTGEVVGTSMNAERLAVKLALEGHERVKIQD